MVSDSSEKKKNSIFLNIGESKLFILAHGISTAEKKMWERWEERGESVWEQEWEIIKEWELAEFGLLLGL